MEKLKQNLEKEPPIKSFEAVVEIWKNRNREAMDADLDKQAQLRTNVDNREKIVNDTELLSLLAAYNIDLSKIDIREEEGNNYAIKVKRHFSAERLPESYGYKGGAARDLLLRNLGLHVVAKPRDIDVIRLTAVETQPNLDNELAAKFMPDDLAHGYGVEYIADPKEYFDTRDFTINEVLATDEEIIATRQCILDTVRRIIRLTDYELNKTDERSGDKMMAKALRLYTENISRYGNAEIANIEHSQFEQYSISPFWLAVNLDRAFSQGIGMAEQFIKILIEKKQIPDTIKTPEEAAEYLVEIMEDNDYFYYRYAPDEQFELENKWLEYEKVLPKFAATKKSRRTADKKK